MDAESIASTMGTNDSALHEDAQKPVIPETPQKQLKGQREQLEIPSSTPHSPLTSHSDMDLESTQSSVSPTSIPSTPSYPAEPRSPCPARGRNANSITSIPNTQAWEDEVLTQPFAESRIGVNSQGSYVIDFESLPKPQDLYSKFKATKRKSGVQK